MSKKTNKHRLVLYCMNACVCLVYLVGIFIFHLKVDGFNSIGYTFSVLAIVVLSFIILIRIPDEVNDEN